MKRKQVPMSQLLVPALHKAAKLGDAEKVFLLLEQDIDIDAQDTYGKTVLMWAAREDHADLVKQLLDKGSNPNIKDRYNQTALLSAVKQGFARYHEPGRYLNTVQALIEGEANVNATDASGKTVLMLAVESYRPDFVKALLGANADVSAILPNGTTALSLATVIAVGGGSRETVDLLKQAGGKNGLIEALHSGDENLIYSILLEHEQLSGCLTNYSKALSLAASKGMSNVVKRLLSLVKDVDCSPALLSAGSAGHLDLVETFIQRGADVNVKGTNNRTPLIEAAIAGHSNVVEMLLKAGANTNSCDKKGYTAGRWAAECDRDNIVRMLADTGSHIGILEAVLLGDIDIIRRLIQEGIDLNDRKSASYGTPLLSVAVHKGKAETVQMLVENGADANAQLQHSNQKSALMYAVENGNLELVKYLLARGADPNARGYWGVYALSIAASNGFAEIAGCLLEYGAIINVSDPYDNYTGSRSLILAAEKGHIDTVRALVNAGADIDVGLRFAAKGGHCDLIRYLAKRGGNINSRSSTSEMDMVYRPGTYYSSSPMKGQTVLDYALNNFHPDAVKLLIELGVNLPQSSCSRFGSVLNGTRAIYLDIKRNGTASVRFTQSDASD